MVQSNVGRLWDFVAGYFLSGKTDVTPPDGLKEVKEWSSTHVRLRAELFLTSALIFSVNQFGTDLERIPFVGIELHSPVPREVFIVGLVAFFIFIGIALLFRTLAENQATISPDRLLQDAAARLDQSIESLAQSKAAALAPDLSHIASQVEKASTMLAQSSWSNAGESIQHMLESTDMRAKVVLDEIRRAMEVYTVAASGKPADEMTFQADLQLVTHRLHNVLKERFKSDEKMLETAQVQLDGFRAAESELDDRIAEIRRHIETYANEADRLIVEHEAEAIRIVNEATNQIDKARRDIRGIRRVTHLDRNLTSLWIPVGVSLALFFAAWVPLFDQTRYADNWILTVPEAWISPMPGGGPITPENAPKS
ncbi:hypothetical protein [Devosia sp.]|uniref:hypothetical protein n=1 Tax=Devosia sp. TaxID=1871048 RepID=UPI0029300383|nr:hypothetical protein [Devosia sp.]